MRATTAYTLDVLNPDQLIKTQGPVARGRLARRPCRARYRKRPAFTVATTVVATLVAGTMVAPTVSAAASSLPSAPIFLANGNSAQATPLHGKGSSNAWWEHFLADSKNLGPTRSRAASVLVQLKSSTERDALERWAYRWSLKVAWFAGLPSAEVSGVPMKVGHAFRVVIDDYIAPDGQRFYSSTHQPGVPRMLARVVSGVGRMSNYNGVKMEYVGSNGLLPADLANAYDSAPLRAQGLDGSGYTVVAFETDGFTPGFLTKFTTQFRLPAFNSSNFIDNGGEAGPAQGESDMDLQTIREIAPGARIVYYNIRQALKGNPNLTIAGALTDAFTNANKEYPGAIWTLSLGWCERIFTFSDLNTINQAVVAAIKNGTTVFASSGDSGGLECVPEPNWGNKPTQSDVGVAVPSVLTAVSGVGGTNLSVTTNGTYLSETPWYYPVAGEGTTGGTSTILGQPTWQTGGGLPKASNNTGRETPDISAVGDPVTGNAIYEGGGWTEGGGTSLSSPIWAGFTVLIDQYLKKHNKPAVGFLNAYLYYLYNHSSQYAPFHPVNTGGNDVWRNGNGFNQSTGLGTPDVYNLARDILTLEGGH